ncbi:transposase [Psychrobacter cryohalolentis]|uniref:transposase n=1 Tax=Psychrobacter sp. D2 TaxID=2759702 RepID=UPI0015E5DD75|nr:transposase [Psychrobacter sp. D2]MBA2057633.1 transposase [Psychrobacter sp. D2]
MTNKRNQYTREFKLEAINLVVEHKRKIPDVADSLGIGKSTLRGLSHTLTSQLKTLDNKKPHKHCVYGV